MNLRLFNTETGKKEAFEPLEDGKVKMYVCGVTVYDFSHIGHARCYTAFDVVYRYLKFLGLDVKYVRNFTDVDDKIIKRANELGVSPRELTDRNIAAYHEDMDALGCLRPDVEPRVTDHMEAIIELIGRIVDRGHGYVGPDGTVYFSIDSFARYGRLSGRNLADMQAGASERVDDDPNKRNPMDFVLWKPSKPGEPEWKSPWCAGRPGWHIECSAMSATHLGVTFDIHGGGKDLVFPHHENEIAQSEAASGELFVRYWMHNGFVNVDSEKMSKSLGNFFTIKDVLKLFHPEAIRMFLLSTHYRSPINYTSKNLEEATGRIEYMYQTVQKLDEAIAEGGPEGPTVLPELAEKREALMGAMSDDFNTAAALGHLFDVLRSANDVLGKKKKTPGRIDALRALRALVSEVSGIFGLLERVASEVLSEIRQRDIVRMQLDVGEIEALIVQRAEARKQKDFATGDQIRDRLVGMGISVQDSPAGTVWGVIRNLE